MDREKFDSVVIQANVNSMRVLAEKQDQYSDPEGNRLQQFYDAAEDEAITPTEALTGMARKHWTSITHMAKNPKGFSMKDWLDKTIDLRNYTYLLEALLIDLGVE